MSTNEEKSNTSPSAKAPLDVRSVYLEGIRYLRIEDQPSGRAGFVSPRENVLTSFQLASRYGNVGLIAHNYLAGKHFFDLKLGDKVHLMDGTGIAHAYQVVRIRRFRALTPRSSRSRLQDLEDDQLYSVNEVFKQIYMGSHHLVLQTCIAEGDVREWGRLFIIAEPV